MHKTSMLKMQSIIDVYLRPRGTGRVLEVGSKEYGGYVTYRHILPTGWEYVGLDLEHGDNVDFVPAHPYVWPELATGSFDACVTGQTFEHNPIFWVTLAEMARVTKPGGVMALIAPGRGPVHRFPHDCWRFYPDSWAALAMYLRLELVESCFDEPEFRLVEDGAHWCDSAAVMRRPVLAPTEEAAFLAHLAAVAATASHATGRGALELPARSPAFDAYRRAADHGAPYAFLRRARRLLNLRRMAHKVMVEP